MYNYKEELVDLVNILFSKPMVIESTKVSLSLLNKDIEIKDLFKVPEMTSGSFKTINGVTISETNSNIDGLKELLSGTSRNSLGGEFYEKFNITSIETASLPISEIALLIYRKGSVTLVNVDDSVFIHKTVGRYLTLVEQRKLYELHYQAPPEEDILAFQTLYDLITDMASSRVRQGEGGSLLSELIRLSSTTASGDMFKNDKVVLNGKRRTALLTENNEPRLSGLENVKAFKK